VDCTGIIAQNGTNGLSDIEHVVLGSRRIDGQAAEGRGAELGKRSIDTARSRESSFWEKRHRRLSREGSDEQVGKRASFNGATGVSDMAGEAAR